MRYRIWVAAGLCAAFLSSNKAFGLLHLTSDGTGEGMQLSVFAGQFPEDSNNTGPIGILVLPSGPVVATDHLGNIREFPSDADNQSAANVPVGQNYGLGNANGLALLNGVIYCTGRNTENIFEINADGTFVKNIASVGGFQLLVNPNDNHLLVADPNNNGIWDVNPISGNTTKIAATSDPDGMTLSPDGSIVYIASENLNHILGYSMATGAQVYDSGVIDGIDGLATGTGLFAGDIFTNTHGGDVIQINLATNAQTIIATGGTRGDFIYVDPTNGSLLVTQSTGQWRISLPVPEPGTFAALAVAAGLAMTRRRRSGFVA